MLLISNKLKYKKLHKGRNLLFKSLEYGIKKNNLIFGFYGLQVNEVGCLTYKQLESARRCITRLTKRKCKIWFRVLPHIPTTIKSKGSRMGKGVGKVNYLIFNIKSGRILLEISFLRYKLAKKALKLASKKLSISCNFISRIRKIDNIFNYETFKYI